MTGFERNTDEHADKACQVRAVVTKEQYALARTREGRPSSCQDKAVFQTWLQLAVWIPETSSSRLLTYVRVRTMRAPL